MSDFEEPKTIKDMIYILDNIYNETADILEINYFNNSTNVDVMYEYHMTLGLQIRNVFLWPKNPNVYSNFYKIMLNLGFEHADDMSNFLLRLFWYYKHEPHISIEKHQERMLNEIIIKDILE